MQKAFELCPGVIRHANYFKNENKRKENLHTFLLYIRTFQLRAGSEISSFSRHLIIFALWLRNYCSYSDSMCSITLLSIDEPSRWNPYFSCQTIPTCLKCVFLCLEQELALFLICLFIFSHYVSDATMNFSGGVLTVYGPNETASIFATYPSEYLTLGRSFLDQVSGEICVYINQKTYF